MRLPNEPCATKTHFLTDYYAKTKFDLDLVEFKNSDNNAFVKFYNMDPITHEGMLQYMLMILLGIL